MTNKNRLIRLEKVKSALEGGAPDKPTAPKGRKDSAQGFTLGFALYEGVP